MLCAWISLFNTIVSFFEAALIFSLCLYNFKIFLSPLKDCFIVFCTTLFLSCFLHHLDFSIALNLSIIFIFNVIFLYFKTKQLNFSIICMFLIYILYIIVNFITFSIVIISFGDKILSTNFYFTYYLIMFLVVYFISYFFKPVISDFKKNIFDFKYYLIFYVLFSFTFISLFFNDKLAKSLTDEKLFSFANISQIFFMFYMLTSITCLLLICSLHKKNLEKNYTKLENENYEEHIKTLEESNDNIRKLKHDMNNIFFSLNAYILNKDSEGLINYIQDSLLPLQPKINADTEKLRILDKIKNFPLKGLLSHKILMIQETGLKVNFNVLGSIDTVNKISIVDLCRILGIFIDNAAEAALESNDKIVNIFILKKENETLFIIENSYNSNTPSLAQMRKNKFSTKGTNRGFGLSIVDELIQKYDNITWDTKFRLELFSQELRIF